MKKLTPQARGRRIKFRNPYWTKKRVLEGLQRAARDIWNNEAAQLPSSTTAYIRAVMEREPVASGEMRRMYPGQNRILDFFQSMNHAWSKAGFIVETVVRRRASEIITPEIDE